MNNLPANQKREWTPSLQEQEARADHREWIGGRTVTLLSHYWRDDDDEALTAAIAGDWADVLEGLPQDAIAKACIQYQRDEPRRKPTPGAIYQLARGFMPKPSFVPRSEPEQKVEPRMTPERAAEITKAAGIHIKRFGDKG